MRVFIKLFLVLSFFSSLLMSEPTFPQLSARIVDEASLLSSNKLKALRQTLKAHENNTTNQVVIVTLKSLQGYEIEEYAYQLGRHWGIGQKAKDNGVLLIVAPNERKVRIEVGYGLEGVLTDKISHDIIQTKILPAFKNGDYPQGIELGVLAILDVLSGEYKAQTSYTSNNVEVTQSYLSENINSIAFIVIFGLFSLWEIISAKGSHGLRLYISLTIATIVAILVYQPFHDVVAALLVWVIVFLQAYSFGRSGLSNTLGSSSGYSGGSSSSSSFSGFSGGGGSFGGGGASGSW